MPADAGIRFGQYVLVRRIARGGMAEVFLAQQRGLEGFDRRVAVKRILPHLSDSPDFVKMFFGEARLAAQLSHPNIVHIYEFGKVESDYFIAMEFVDGVHAGQLFKYGEQEKLPATLVARIGADAAAALHYAHELRGGNGTLLGLVHRDVSPANIMVSFDGVVKLCDFGIAKAAAAGDQLTNPGQVKGKYAYMSPEQTIASQLDGRSDVFSLAIVMWELLTGKYIVPRGDAVAAMRAIRDGKLDPIEKVAPNTPPPLAHALTWALDPRREKRATAADFAQALEAFLKSAPELATSMQLGGWIRSRFPREGTGQMPALNPGGGPAQGTQVSPGTVAAPRTSVSPGTVVAPGTTAGPAGQRPVTQMPVTPPVYPARRVVKRVTDTVDGTEIYTTSDLDDQETIKGARPKLEPTPAIARSGRPGTEEPTMHASQSTLLGEPTEMGRGASVPADEEDSDIGGATIQRGIPTPVPRLGAVVPTHSPQPFEPPGARAVSDSAARVITDSTRGIVTEPGRFNTPLPGTLLRKKRKNLLLAIVGLAGLAAASFAIALVASSSRNQRASTEQQNDAANVVAMTAGPEVSIEPIAADAAVAPAAPGIDAAAVEPAPAVDAAVPVDDGMAYLVVRTIPDGGNIKVGNQTRLATVQPGDPTGAATAQLLLPPGKHTVIAEIDGYRLEKRAVVLEPGDHQRIEIAFTKKIAKRPDPKPATGRLTVRTSPWSDVYLGGKKLGQAPFADLVLPAGTHTLTFKNPSYPTVTKTVTIKPGKPAKLNFALPD